MDDSDEDQGKNTSEIQETLSLPNEHLISLERNIDINTTDGKTNLTKFQMKIKSMLLENEGQSMLVTKWQRIWLNDLHALLFYEPVGL